jgi:lysophospholipase L1-like esterase
MKTWLAATKVNPTDTSLRIVGFGACMISGYPHKSGLFETACELVEKTLSRPVRSTVVSLGGFPAPRAERYLKSKVFDFNPHYVVIQFGATDALPPIRAGSRPRNRSSKPRTNSTLRPKLAFSTDTYHSRPATIFSALRWEVACLIGQLRKIEPITPLTEYTASIERMVISCRSAGITPVVLSPFIYGSRYATRNAVRYTRALHELHSNAEDMILVDCVHQLANFSKTAILQHDGFHLSRLGQDLVGEAIGQAIVADIRIKNADRCVGDAPRHQLGWKER